MKKFFAIAIAMLVATASFAQTETGKFFFMPKAGYSASKLTGAPDSYTTQLGLVAGIELGYQMTDKFALTADVLYSGQGIYCDSKTYFSKDPITIKDDTKLDYLNIPILANYYIVKGLAVKAGVQPGILVSGKSKLSGTFHDGTEKVDLKDITNKVDVSIPVGVSYEWKNIILDARYIFGLTNVNKNKTPFFEELVIDTTGDYTPQPVKKGCKNGVFQLTLGYKLPF